MPSRRSISSLSLEQVIDPAPLIVTPDIPVLEVIDRMSRVRGSGCQLLGPVMNERDGFPTAATAETPRTSCALVVEKERLLGVFTERDLVRLAASANNLDTVTIAEVMTRSIISLSSSDAQNIFLVLATFRAHRIRHLPILDEDGRVVGVVTQQSLRAALQPLNFFKLKPVTDVMITNVVQTSRTTSVLRIAQLMTERRVSCVVITEELFAASSVDEEGKSDSRRTGKGEEMHQPLIPIGIITERDMVQFQTLGLNLARTQAQAVMSTPLFPVKPQDSLWSAHQQMLSRHVRRLVVTDERGLVGIITQSSVLQVLDPVELMGELDQLQQVVDSQTRELQQTNQQLRDEITCREGLEETLRETNAALEQQVGFTTAQLVKANASLRDSEARYRQLFEGNPHPMWVYDLETLAFLTVNDAAVAHYGYSRTEFLAMTICDILPPQSSAGGHSGGCFELAQAIPALEENIAQVTSGIDKAGIWQHLKKDGTAIAIEIISHTITWQGRRAEVVLANDVTEKIQAEAALRQKTQTLEHYSSSLKKLHRISTTHYPTFDALFSDYLSAGCEILGMSTGIISEISKQTYTIRAVQSPFDVESGAEFALSDTYCAAVVAGNQTCTYTHVSTAMQTHPVYQNLRLESYIGTPICVEGQIFGTLNFSATEVRPKFAPYEKEMVELMAQSLGSFISEARLERKRQQAEQATQEALQVARTSENRLRTIIDTEPECIKLIDSDGQLLEINPTGLSLLEVDSLEEVQSQSIYSLIAAEYRQAFQELNERVCQGHRGTLEFEIVSRLGTRRWLETHAAPLWDEAKGQFIQLAIARDVTERKRSERALRESEARYRSLSEKLRSVTANAPIYIYELDRQGRIVFANRTYEGVTQEQVIGTSLTDWFPQEQRPTIASVVEQAFCSGEVQEIEYAIPNPQEEVRFYTTQIAPIVTGAQAESAVLIASDITERKRAEQELERFFSLSLDLLCIAGFDGYFKRLNPAFEAILGWSDQELRSQSFLKFVHPDDRAATTTAVEQLVSGAQVVAFENRYRTANGDTRWLLWSGVPSQSEQLIYAVARDITDRKQVELALQRERDFTAAILDTVGALVVVLDRQGQIVRFNRTCETVTGYSFGEVTGKPVWDLVLPQEKPTVQAVFARLLNGQFQNQYENIWVSKTGEQRLISWSNTALTDERGSVDYVIATGIDVTERRQAQKKLERSYQQAQLLAQVTRKIRNSLELEDILQTTVTEVQSLLACDRVLIYQVFPDGTGKTITEAVLPEYTAILGTTFSEEVFPQECREQYRQGRIRALADVHALDANLPQCLVEFVEQWSVKAKLVIPILQNPNASESSADSAGVYHSSNAAHNQLWGLLIAHQCSRPRQWEPLEINLLRQLGDQIGVALSQAQILDHLEERVAERTIDLTNANQQLQQKIRERQLAQVALQENQQKLAGILETADEAIISVDQEQRIQLFNQGAEKIFGYTAEEVLGEPLDLLLPEVFRVPHQKHVRHFNGSQSISRQIGERSANFFGRRKNGEEFPAEASVSKLQLQSGVIFTVILKDITERQRSEAALRRSEAQLRLITDALPVLISYVDVHERYRFVNQSYEEWFGLSRLQIKGRQVREIVGEAAYQQIQTYINTALSGQPVIFETEVPFKRRSRWISGTYVPDFEKSGAMKGFFALISDISDLKAVQQMKSEFISVVSHELRTPLTSIHGSLKLLSTGRLGNLTQPGQEMLHIALKNTARLTRLVNDILDLERIESGKVTLSPQTCSAADLIVQAIEAMAGMARAENITLASAPETVQVWADPDSVVQILTNLISNAIKFSPPSSTVWLAAAEQEQQVLFQVRDQGRGIPADKLKSIFERFQQVDASDSRSKGGTGLGLAICQEIVCRHGGRIWAESTLGEGSTFFFTLPISKQEESRIVETTDSMGGNHSVNRQE